jgi:hypothetical protein
MNSRHITWTAAFITLLLACSVGFADITVESIDQARQLDEPELWGWFTVSVRPDYDADGFIFDVSVKEGLEFSTANNRIYLERRDKDGNTIQSRRLRPEIQPDHRSVVHFTVSAAVASHAVLSFRSDNAGLGEDFANMFIFNVDLASYVGEAARKLNDHKLWQQHSTEAMGVVYRGKSRSYRSAGPWFDPAKSLVYIDGKLRALQYHFVLYTHLDKQINDRIKTKKPTDIVTYDLPSKEWRRMVCHALDVTKNGAYVLDGWEYVYKIVNGEDRLEGWWGYLYHENKHLGDLPGLKLGQKIETPWGVMYWVGIPQMVPGYHGWLPYSLARDCWISRQRSRDWQNTADFEKVEAVREGVPKLGKPLAVNPQIEPGVMDMRQQILSSVCDGISVLSAIHDIKPTYCDGASIASARLKLDAVGHYSIHFEHPKGTSRPIIDLVVTEPMGEPTTTRLKIHKGSPSFLKMAQDDILVLEWHGRPGRGPATSGWYFKGIKNHGEDMPKAIDIPKAWQPSHPQNNTNISALVRVFTGVTKPYEDPETKQQVFQCKGQILRENPTGSGCEPSGVRVYLISSGQLEKDSVYRVTGRLSVSEHQIKGGSYPATIRSKTYKKYAHPNQNQEPVRSFETLAGALQFIVDCLDKNDYPKLVGICVGGHKPNGVYLAQYRTPFDMLRAAHQKESLLKRYDGKRFPEEEKTFKLGGHMSELGCVHVDFVKKNDQWFLADIWNCR